MNLTFTFLKNLKLNILHRNIVLHFWDIYIYIYIYIYICVCVCVCVCVWVYVYPIDNELVTEQFSLNYFRMHCGKPAVIFTKWNNLRFLAGIESPFRRPQSNTQNITYKSNTYHNIFFFHKYWYKTKVLHNATRNNVFYIKIE